MMGPECYKVEVLHYLNPHIIWVEKNTGGAGKISFEQIGIYGILPMNTDIDETGVVSMKRCDEWVPAATVVLSKLLHRAEEVWFSPTYIDRRNSIFNENTMKFGDIIIKTKKGEVSVLEELIESSFCMFDECIFHQGLSTGSVKTKLNYITTLQVIKTLEQSFDQEDKHNKDGWLKSLRDQTSVFHMSVNLENSVASRNIVPRGQKNTTNMLQNKFKDFMLCKDVDEDSAGRANSLRSSSVASQVASLGLRKKLDLVKTKETDVNTVDSIASTPSVNIPSNTATKNSEWDDADVTDACIKNKSLNQSDKKVKTSDKKIKEFDPDIKHVAFGPPGMNPAKLNMKVLSKASEEENAEEPPKPKVLETEYTNTNTQYPNMFAKEDSDVDLKITNLEALKTKVETSNHLVKLKPPSIAQDKKTPQASSLQRKLRLLQEKMSKKDSTLSGLNKNSVEIKNQLYSDDESISDLAEKLNLSNASFKSNLSEEKIDINISVGEDVKNNVNPYKNVDGSQSVFVDKLVSPILMVHTKNNNRIQTSCNLRDIPFGSDVQIVLRNMSIRSPMRPQTISWPTILRGHSLFLISPSSSGKTMGYLPSVCQLVADNKKISDGFGPSCIIVCSTSKSVSDVERLCKMFLHDVRIFACYAGMNEMTITTSLLNGCDLLICTPCPLVRLIQKDFGVDLRNLSTFVLDDCERLSEVYPNELKFALLKIKEMLKIRANKEWKVQYVVASRIWCNFMSSLAKKSPDSVVCIGAFQECVLYSKVSTSVNFVKLENKITAVLEFMKNIDRSKKTVIACRSDSEVNELKKALTKLNYVVFACDSTMTLHDLYKLDLALSEYEEPVTGPILVCCDGNLTHLNVTNAHYLIHYSLPELFSMFCKRFSVLNDNYPSIFDNNDGNLKIKILLDDSNVEQLPKILNFIRRCSEDVPTVLDNIGQRVLVGKDLVKAQALVPICGNLLSSGKCPDLWNCQERHGIFKEYDTPREWLPIDGIVTFKILHYHTAVSYSVRLLSNIDKGSTKKYPQNYSLLSIKMGLYYSKEINKVPHGIPVIGDVCAVAVKQNLFERCQVVKILQYSRKGTPEIVLIKLIDEDKYERTRDVYLYHLPDDLKKIETHVVRVVLSNIQPEDRDVTFSELARDQLKKITDKDEDLYLRGQVALVIGNIVFVETLEACQDLSSLGEIVVKHDFKRVLLDGHAVSNPEHVPMLQKLCSSVNVHKREEVKITEIPKSIKILPKARWAHFENDFMSVFYAYADSPGKFYLRLVKFNDCINMLLNDIKKYVTESPEPIEELNIGDIVLAKFPDDETYERARIDAIVDEKTVRCFFVDQGDLRDVYRKDLVSIIERFITQLPFQAIECSLIGIQPVGDDWTEFSTNWFIDNCFDSNGKLKYLFAKYFSKQKAELTEGNKYNIVLIDTYSENDVVINQFMIDLNLARENEEISYLEVNFKREEPKVSDEDTDDEIEVKNTVANKTTPIEHLLLREPIRSVPLVNSDSDDSTSWNINMPEQFMPMFDSKPDAETQATDPKLTSNLKMLPPPKASSTLDSDDLSSMSDLSSGIKSEVSDKTIEYRKPKLCWRQNQSNVSIKIQLIGVEKYRIVIKERYLKFRCVSNDFNFGFEFELYGGVDSERSSHSNRGQYILVNLHKITRRQWRSLTKEEGTKKWIVYDVDDIDTSSDEEVVANNLKEIIKHTMDGLESDSDDEFLDDANFTYR